MNQDLVMFDQVQRSFVPWQEANEAGRRPATGQEASILLPLNKELHRLY